MSHITHKITRDTTVQFYRVKYDMLYNGLLSPAPLIASVSRFTIKDIFLYRILLNRVCNLVVA
jgi:hypothetical protein